MMPTPLACSRRITSNSTRTSAVSSEEVGSSITTSTACSETARARATICCRATLSFITGTPRSTCTPRPASSSAGLAAHPRPVHATPASERLAAQEDVLGRGEVRDQVDFLVDGGDAGGLRLGGRVEGDLPALRG